MSLRVTYNKLTNKDDVYEAVKAAVTPEMLSKFQVRAELDYKKDLISAKGRGFKLDMKFEESSCIVDLDLSFLLKPLKGKILEGIEKQLKRVV